MISITEALKHVTPKKASYFKWKFGIGYKDSLNNMSWDQFTDTYKVTKNKNEYEKWERTPEYNYLVNIYLNNQAANDLLETYNIVREKAKTGDEKQIKLMLELQKQIKANAKESAKLLTKKDEQEKDDGLIV